MTRCPMREVEIHRLIAQRRAALERERRRQALRRALLLLLASGLLLALIPLVLLLLGGAPEPACPPLSPPQTLPPPPAVPPHQPAGDRPRPAVAHRAAVDPHHRQHLGRRARQEQLVGAVQLLAAQGALL